MLFLKIYYTSQLKFNSLRVVISDTAEFCDGDIATDRYRLTLKKKTIKLKKTTIRHEHTNNKINILKQENDSDWMSAYQISFNNIYYYGCLYNLFERPRILKTVMMVVYVPLPIQITHDIFLIIIIFCLL